MGCRFHKLDRFTQWLLRCRLPTSYGPHVIYPGGKCGAYYYKTDFGSGGVTTQAATECEIDEQRLGGNVVALHTLKHCVGLMQTRWEFQYRKASLLKINGRVISTQVTR